MNQPCFRAVLCTIPLLLASLHGQSALAAIDPALEVAPANGYAAQNGGTTGGSAALVSQIYTVRTGAQLRNAAINGGNLPKIIKVVGLIDMTDGVPFASKADQSVRGIVALGKNTTLIGMGKDAGLVNGSIVIKKTSNVIVRNLKIQAPCDVQPTFDSAEGNWNADYDAIHVEGSSNVWIDRNTITDGSVTDDTLPTENGAVKQCHDGAIDITHASDFVTVSYNVIRQHDKTMLIGSSDTGSTATADVGKLRVTIANNVFDSVKQRVPRVRFGTVHMFNNYFVGNRSAALYPHTYSIGAGQSSTIISKNNLFAIADASGCDQIVQYPNSYTNGTFADSGSTLNGAALSGCSVATNTATVPYNFTARPTALVKTTSVALAGSGKITSAVVGTGHVTSTAGSLVPAKGEVGSHTDTSLSMGFDSMPILGSSGKITLRKVSDDSEVTSIDVGSTPSSVDLATQVAFPKANKEIDAIALGAIGGDPNRARFVWYRPVTISGNTASIKLKSNRLAYNTAYYVTVDASVFDGATINGQAFAGITKADGWSFTTKAAPASYTSVTVDDDGTTADFRTLQGALNHVMTYCGTSVAANGCNTVSTPKTISIANGNYNELNLLRNVAGLSIVGESREGVVVGSANFESWNSGSGGTATAIGTSNSTSAKAVGLRTLGGGRASFLVEGSDLLTMRNFTLQNPHARSTLWDNQAEAIYFNTSTTTAAARMVAKQMNFLSQQDTLQLKGYVWVYDSLVAGNVDWIWGNVMAALFENSEIRYVQDTSSNSAGFIVQSRATGTVTGSGAAATFSVTDKGFVFLNSSLTNDGKTKLNGSPQELYLARNGANATVIDQILFINTRMGSHVQAAGWCVGLGKSNAATFQQAIAGQNGLCSANSNPTPQPDIATDSIGWREYGSMDLEGNPLDISSRLSSLNVNIYNSATGTTLTGTKTISPSKVLSAIPAGYNNRAEIFSGSTIATGAAGGWAPEP